VGRDMEALDLYRTLLDQDPRNATALNNAAWLADELGERDALIFAQRAYELAPENPAIQDTLGWILVRQNRETDGVLLLEQAAELATEIPAIRYHLAYAYSAVGRRGEALAILEDVVQDGRPFDERREAEALVASLRKETE
jgi:Flp pilus assembly protein TadD